MELTELMVHQEQAELVDLQEQVELQDLPEQVVQVARQDLLEPLVHQVHQDQVAQVELQDLQEQVDFLLPLLKDGDGKFLQLLRQEGFILVAEALVISPRHYTFRKQVWLELISKQY